MLDKQDLQAIAELIDTKLEQQTKAFDTKLEQQSQRFDAKLEQQESNIMQNVAVLMESKFQPQFNLLAEGQKTILETLAPKSRVEELAEEVGFLKSIIKMHSEQIAELKKAQ